MLTGPPEQGDLHPTEYPFQGRDFSHSRYTAPRLEAKDSQAMTSHSKDQAVPVAAVTPSCKLESLPPELIHQILDDLPVSSVLLLLSFRKPGSYLHRCVLCHPQYRQVFTRQEALTTARDLFVLLYEIATSVHLWPVDLGVLDGRHEHGSLTTNGINPCKECLHVLRKGLCDVIAQKTVEMVGSLSVEREENTEGYEEVSLTMLPATERRKRQSR